MEGVATEWFAKMGMSQIACHGYPPSLESSPEVVASQRFGQARASDVLAGPVTYSTGGIGLSQK